MVPGFIAEALTPWKLNSGLNSGFNSEILRNVPAKSTPHTKLQVSTSGVERPSFSGPCHKHTPPTRSTLLILFSYPQMRSPRYNTTRQKSCRSCIAAKARCDRKPAGCSRCSARKSACIYPRPGPNASEADGGDSILSSELPDNDIGHASKASLPQPSTLTYAADLSVTTTPGNKRTCPATARALETVQDDLDFSDLHLICPIDASQISNRWLSPYVAISGQKPKSYPDHVTVFIRGILGSYASKIASARGCPPFVHSSQTTANTARPPLSTCLTLVRACGQPLPGSEDAVMDVIRSQMNTVFESHQAFDPVTMLAAFQAYVMYCMTLHFKFGRQSKGFLRQAMVNMQEIASSSSRQGLMCVAETRSRRPAWEEWIVAESKRRTLFTMYLFDSLLTTEDGLPTFLGLELRGLFAPGGKSLWAAQSRGEWEEAYNSHLARWPEGYLRIEELWPLPPDVDDDGVGRRQTRVQQWLEDVDEYGIMMYAVTSPTHGI